MKQREIKSKGYKNSLVWYSENYESIGLFFTDMERIKAKIMQYTGLKDKNGKEIQEGDIVSINDKKYIVKWFNKLTWDSGCLHPGFYFKGFDETFDYKEVVDLDYHTSFHNIEIIGNIYENKELVNA